MGDPLDDLGPLTRRLTDVPLDAEPPHPMRRARIDSPLSLGIRAWDTLSPLGRGQRVGIFAGSGVGKSTLLGMIARNTAADVNVVALIGERGREVREFVESRPRPRGPGAFGAWSSPRRTRRRWCASVPRSSPPASPSGSATRATT